jgi:hypothetical protein
VVLLLSPFMVAAGFVAVFGITYLVHVTVAGRTPTVELYFLVLFVTAILGLGVFGTRRGMRGRLRRWEVEELRRRR